MRPVRWRAAMLLGWSAVAAWSSGACTFPDFVVIPAGLGSAGTPATGGAGMQDVAGSVSTGGAGANALGGGGAAGSHGGGGGAGDGGSGGGGNPNGGTAGDAGTAGNAGGGGGPEPIEVGPCGERAHPLHCSNHELDIGETDVDCGGFSCLPCAGDETCTADRDCATGACTGGKCQRMLSLK